MFAIRNILFLSLFLAAFVGKAQSWTHLVPWTLPSDSNGVHAAHELSNGDYIIGGYISNSPAFVDNGYLARLDPFGTPIWQRNLDYPAVGEALEQPTGHFMCSSFYPAFPFPYPLSKASVFRTDATGNVQWEYFIDPGINQLSDTMPIQMVSTPDMGAAVACYIRRDSAGMNFSYRHLIKLDSLGNVVFERSYRRPEDYLSSSLAQLSNGDFILTSYVYPQAAADSVNFMRTDPLGNVIWEKSYRYDQVSQTALVKETVTGDLALALTNKFFSFGLSANLFLVNSMGDSLWFGDLSPVQGDYQLGAILPTADSGFVLTGNYTGGSVHEGWIGKYDKNRSLTWSSTFPTGYDNRTLLCVDSTSDNGYVTGGRYAGGASPSDPATFGAAFKLDSAGDLARYTICGSAFFDTDSNCIPSTGEAPIPSLVVSAHPGPFFSTTDSLGNFFIDVGTPNSQLTFHSPYNIPWSLNCAPSDTLDFTFTQSGDTLCDYLSLSGPDACPFLDVQIGVNALRPCFQSTYTVNYTNFATTAIQNGIVTLEFDIYQTVLSASLPYSFTAPNTYTFNVGTVDSLSTGSFGVTIEVDCNAPVGIAQCVTARGFPDTLCAPSDPNWSGASLSVMGECTGNDSIVFTISNDGTGNMQAFSGLWILEDDILRTTDSVFLAVGQDTSYTIQGNGSTWACLVDQVPLHPGISLPRAIVEACGVRPDSTFSTGFVQTRQTDDLNPSIDINCTVITNSYDPNDKVGFPLGIDTDHRILDTDHLEYRIRFQNTGTDTAFKVVIRDQIPSNLNLGTLLQGTSSHSYTFAILPGNILEWTFDNIYLPDSNVNEPASHGFLTFQIEQAPGNQPGDRIENAANIFFDFNAPILTDLAWHTIADESGGVIVLDQAEATEEALPQLTAFPNPFTEEVTFRFEALQPRRIVFDLYDMQGRHLFQQQHRHVREFTMDRGNLPRGVYFFRIDADGQVQSGKIIIK